MTKKRKIVISANTAWNVYNFRRELIKALQEAKYSIIVIAPRDNSVDALKAIGCEFVHINMSNSGTSIFEDARLFWSYFCKLRKINASAYLGFTVKPNIFGSLAAQCTNTPVINNISGLGTVFIKKNWVTHLVSFLYKVALAQSKTVFFQNVDDHDLFVSKKIVKSRSSAILPGSGIDLTKYKANAPFPKNPNCRFILIARLLWDKGVQEYVDAAKKVKQTHPGVVFEILGFLGVDNKTAVSKAKVDEWILDGIVSYHGTTKDVRPYIEQVNCVVLPSYREGTPRTLLEAAALSRPIITTDVPGCRQVVYHGKTGFLCEVKNSDDLARKMINFMALSPEAQQRMGEEGRKKIVNEYDINIVIKKYLTAIVLAQN